MAKETLLIIDEPMIELVRINEKQIIKMNKLKKCKKCNVYTFKEKCPKCKSPTANGHYKFIKTPKTT